MFTLPVMLVFAVIMPLFFFMGANIMAKRIRDIGLPGWWVVLTIIVITGIVSYVFSKASIIFKPGTCTETADVDAAGTNLLDMFTNGFNDYCIVEQQEVFARVPQQDRCVAVPVDYQDL